MRNIKLVISYDGTDFHGWQVQPGYRTVQQVFEDALAALTGARTRVNASGRTDTGVHALGWSRARRQRMGLRLDGGFGTTEGLNGLLSRGSQVGAQLSHSGRGRQLRQALGPWPFTAFQKSRGEFSGS